MSKRGTPAASATCASCHATGANGAPLFMAMDAEASYTKITSGVVPGLLAAPANSILLLHGQHTGPALQTAQAAIVTQWLNDLLARQGPDILRAKGILNVAGDDRRLVFQAVHMILEGDLQRPWGADEKRWSRAVFIGRNLDETKLREGFEACAA